MTAYNRVSLCIDPRRCLWNQDQLPTVLGDSNCWRRSNKSTVCSPRAFIGQYQMLVDTKMLVLSTSIWSARHPNTGRNYIIGTGSLFELNRETRINCLSTETREWICKFVTWAFQCCILPSFVLSLNQIYFSMHAPNQVNFLSEKHHKARLFTVNIFFFTLYL